MDIIMTSDEFNKKWEKYLEVGFYVLSIDHPEVINYIDNQFSKEIETNPSFKYSQIKMKFNSVRVYADSDNTSIWEDEIDKILS
jgi:hypothetical protein